MDETVMEADVQERVRNDLLSVVSVVKDGEVERVYLINFSRNKTKAWLTSTLVWCLTNGRTLSTRRASIFDLASRRVFNPSNFE